MMKNEMTTNNDDVLDLNKEGQFNDEILVTLEDNSDWEYTRLGFGEDEQGLYLVDLNDSGEILRDKQRINSIFSLMDVLEEGVAHNVFTKDGEEGNETYYYNWDMDGHDCWDNFLNVVLA